jgi:hypothetical protein
MKNKFRRLIRVITCISGLLTITILNGSGQEMPSLLPNTPEATALIQNVEYPINYSTGLPDISIPFFSIKVQDLTLPVSISYRPGGFKANEEEGTVGLGWSLSTDFQITRIINGLDDFRFESGEQYGYYYQDDGRQYFQYYQLNPQVLGSYEYFQRSFNKALQEWYRGNVDIQPDCFYYSLISGRSGKFYLQKTEGVPVTIVQVPYTGVTISIT